MGGGSDRVDAIAAIVSSGSLIRSVARDPGRPLHEVGHRGFPVYVGKRLARFAREPAGTAFHAAKCPSQCWLPSQKARIRLRSDGLRSSSSPALGSSAAAEPERQVQNRVLQGSCRVDEAGVRT
jgi:hypothetical protein